MEQNDEKTVRTPEEAVREYQCSGCMSGPYPDCYRTEPGYSVSCREHFAGTGVIPIGKIFPGMPTGFNRLGPYGEMRVIIHEEWVDDFTAMDAIEFTKWNVPVWKHLDKYGNTLVRGLRPRLNEPFLVVILGDHLDKIDCYEVTEEDIQYMDY